MGAWNKLFTNKNIVSSTATVKAADGATRTVKAVVGAAGLSSADFAEAVKAGGATLTESRKEVNDRGEEVQYKNVIKPGDITSGEAYGATCDVLGLAVAAPKEKVAAPKEKVAAPKEKVAAK